MADASNATRITIAPALDAVGAHEGPLEIDVGNLLVSDVGGLEFTMHNRDREQLAMGHARNVVQRLVASLFALPSETDVTGRFAQLPDGETTFPRARALPPSEKPLTKWEAFAKDKGIKKRKREKHVFDEQSDEWKRRHGYQRARDANEVLIMPGKWSEVPGQTEDPFTREEREKRERVGKNQEKQNKNLMKAVATHGVKALPPTLRLAVTGKKGAVGANKLSKREMTAVAAQVAHSTASVGKFNAPVAGDDKIKIRGKRRQFTSVTEVEAERTKSAELVQKLLRKDKERGGDLFDVNKAARHIQQEKEKANRKRKSKPSSDKGEGDYSEGRSSNKGKSGGRGGRSSGGRGGRSSGGRGGRGGGGKRTKL